MKIPSSRRPAAKTSALRLLLPFFTLFALPPGAPAASEAGAAAPKTHTLFMGVDFSVEYKKQYYRVQDVVGGSFVVSVEGQAVKVPANWGAIKVKVDRSLKITGAPVAVDHLTAERAYTPANDPAKKFMREQGEMLAAGDAMAAASANEGGAQIAATVAQRGAVAGPAGVVQGMPTQSAALAERNFNSAAADAQASFGRSIDTVGRMQSESALQLYDAIDVEFDIAAGQTLARPYVVVMAQYHAPASRPDEGQNWLYATALDPLDGNVRRVRLRQGGFPAGYKLDSYQVHLYDGGVEVATTVSDKRVPLTRSEAFAYLLLDYLAGHKGATLPAAPAMGKLDPETQARLSAGELTHNYYVKVSKDGLPVGAFDDAEMSHPVAEPVASLVGNVRFYPALENGRTVEGVAQLRFSRLAI